MPKLSRIAVYPIKSLDGVSVESIDVLPSGALAWDRRFAIVDTAGRMITGKRTSAVYAVYATYDLAAGCVTLRYMGQTHRDRPAEATFSFDGDRDSLNRWFTSAFDQPCQLLENTNQGFPDDVEALGPTVLSTATLDTIVDWFDGLDDDEVRQRFRANLEINTTEPFWEDRLIGTSLSNPVRFSIGAVEYFGMKPCQRCIVPTRTPGTGIASPGFAKEFARLREKTLPDFAPRERFDHFYRLAVNTSPASTLVGRRIQVGDAVEIIGQETLRPEQ